MYGIFADTKLFCCLSDRRIVVNYVSGHFYDTLFDIFFHKKAYLVFSLYKVCFLCLYMTIFCCLSSVNRTHRFKIIRISPVKEQCVRADGAYCRPTSLRVPFLSSVKIPDIPLENYHALVVHNPNVLL